MLKQATEWLEHQRQQNLAEPMTYIRKDGKVLSVRGTSGKTLFRAEDQYGVTVRTTSCDFLIAAADLPEDPVRGDKILCAGCQYEVLAPNSEPVWRWCGTYRWTRRVHTKEMGRC